MLTRHGIEVVSAKGRGVLRRRSSITWAAKMTRIATPENIDAWISEIGWRRPPTPSVITTSGCGTTIKDYGGMFREDRNYAAKAKRVSAIAKDITE